MADIWPIFYGCRCMFMKKKKVYMHTCSGCKVRCLGEKKCYTYSHMCNMNSFPCVNYVVLSSNGIIRQCRQCMCLLALTLEQVLQCYSFSCRVFPSIILLPREVVDRNSWRYLKDLWRWHLGTWLSGGLAVLG